jgi:hypothetical protein
LLKIFVDEFAKHAWGELGRVEQFKEMEAIGVRPENSLPFIAAGSDVIPPTGPLKA